MKEKGKNEIICIMSDREKNAVRTAEMIRKKELSVREVLDQVYENIRLKDGELNCYITPDKENAYKAAEAMQKRIDAGEDTGKLAGVPVAVKDNLCTKALRTTCASKMLESYIPPYDAGVVTNIKKAGGIITGKTNMDEFAFGSRSDTSYFGPVRNPADIRRSAGGSSGGSAAAVAAGEALIALGTDTGGSVRLPASHCGIVGIKPTYGRASRYGLIAYASSFDQAGVMAADVESAAFALDCICSYDLRDATSINCPDMLGTEVYDGSVKGMRIGVCEDVLEKCDRDVAAAVNKAAQELERAGAYVETLSIKNREYELPAYYALVSAEASSNLERYDGVKYGYRSAEYTGLEDMYLRSRTEGFGEEVKRRIMLGSFVLSAGYYDEIFLRAMNLRKLITREYDELFKHYDLLIGPVSTETAPLLNEKEEDPVKEWYKDLCTVSANLGGYPAMSLPCGCDGRGMPIGLHLMSGRFRENNMIKAAYALERILSEAE